MKSKCQITSFFLTMLLAQVGVASDCADVVKLSAITEETVKDEDSLLADAKQFCSAYSKNKSKKNDVSVDLGFEGFTLGGASASTNATSIARELCSSSNLKKVNVNAYRNYIRKIAPQAYDSYNKCLEAGTSLKVRLQGGSENQASIKVAFDSDSADSYGMIVVKSHDSIKCNWSSDTTGSKSGIKLEEGNSELLTCKRQSSAKKGYITINDNRSANINSAINIPWAAYENNVPVDYVTRYRSKTSEAALLISSLSKSVIAFRQQDCPDGFEPYTAAYGRFIRGLDKGGEDGKGTLDIERALESLQDSQNKKHRHGMLKVYNGDNHRASKEGNDRENVTIRETEVKKTYYSGGSESRPANVALLYCTPI